MDIEGALDDYIEAENPSTEKGRRNRLRRWHEWWTETKGYDIPDDFSQTKFKKYRRHLRKEVNYTSATASQHISTIRGFCKFIGEDEVWENFDYAGLDRDSQKRKKLEFNYIEQHEFEQLLAECKGRNAFRNDLMLRVLWDTGVRVGEFCNITLDDVNLAEGEIYIETLKGGKDRTVYLHQFTKTRLREWIDEIRWTSKYADESVYLFPTERKPQMSRHSLARVVEQVAEDSGLQSVYHTSQQTGNEYHEITPHTFRHSFACLRVINDINIYKLQQLMGHRNVSTTEYYLGVKEQTLKEANRASRPNYSKKYQ